MQADAIKSADVVWRPDAQTVEGANLTHFMRALGVDTFEALNERASTDPAWFNDALFRFLDYRFERPYEQTTWTFADLDRETCRLAWGLRRLGLGRGDVVGMYLPNLPHAAAAMLAVAKIGGIVLPMFSGFGADAVAQRLNDGRAKALITVDGSLRRGKPVGAKTVVDEALGHCPGVRHVVVLGHLQTAHEWKDGRDHGWHELAAGAPDDVEAVPSEPMPADAPFLLMFTSGTTGKPKGVVHSHCGFPVKTALDLSICMDLKPEDRFLWMSDMGWLVGPIKIAGKRTGPSEIEALLMGTGLLLDAVAVGTPDPIKGTAVVCVCVARPGVDQAAAAKSLSAAVVAGLGGAFRPAEAGGPQHLVNPESVQAIRTVGR